MDVRTTTALAAIAALLTVAVVPLTRSGGVASASQVASPSRAVSATPTALPGSTPPINLRDLDQPAAPSPTLTLTDGAGPGQPVGKLWESWTAARLNVSFSPLISDAASRTGLPYDFLYRLLRQESGLRADAVSPRGALGIAQFMPATAQERGLTNPFDPSQAVIKAAELLRDHWARFGNLGLAAAAYNAGPGRVERWLAGASGMPRETRDYVAIVTGRAVEGWVPAGRWASLERAPEAGLAPAAPIAAAPVPRILSPRAGAEAPSRLPARTTHQNKPEARRLAVTARSEDELCALVGSQAQSCIVRRTY